MHIVSLSFDDGLEKSNRLTTTSYGPGNREDHLDAAADLQHPRPERRRLGAYPGFLSRKFTPAAYKNQYGAHSARLPGTYDTGTSVFRNTAR